MYAKAQVLARSSQPVPAGFPLACYVAGLLSFGGYAYAGDASWLQLGLVASFAGAVGLAWIMPFPFVSRWSARRLDTKSSRTSSRRVPG